MRRGFAARGEVDVRRGTAGGRGHRARAGGRPRGRAGRVVVQRWATRWRGSGARSRRATRFRRALTLGLEPSFNARVYAALGRVHARAGEWTAAARALRKALDLAGPGEDDRGVAARLRPRARTARRSRGDGVADARRAGRRREAPPLIVEAATATTNHERAEALLREGLESGGRAIGRCARRSPGGSRRPGRHRRGDREPPRRASPRHPTASTLSRGCATATPRPPLERCRARRRGRSPPGRPAAVARPRDPRARRRRSRRPTALADETQRALADAPLPIPHPLLIPSPLGGDG